MARALTACGQELHRARDGPQSLLHGIMGKLSDSQSLIQQRLQEDPDEYSWPATVDCGACPSQLTVLVS